MFRDIRQAQNREGSADTYRFAYHDLPAMPDMSLHANTAVAAADPADKSRDFIETASRNSGMSTRLFRDMEPVLNSLDEFRHPESHNPGSGGIT